ncbi:MAG: transporter substrate-binding domain-containing protein [Oligoflexia bacterium]|nr:transporter substrate-binding domain-containing protein [Oligoflexia bacterium]
MFYKFIINLFVLILLTFIVVGCTSKRSDADSKNFIVVGTASGYAPFVSFNENKEYEGFDIDVAKEISRRMGKKLVLKDLGGMTSLLLALKQGKVDLIIWAISITPERTSEFDLVHYQGEETRFLTMLFWERIPPGISKIEDFNNLKGPADPGKNVYVSVEPGSSNEAFLSRFDFIKTKPMEKISDAILDIRYGKSIAKMVDPAIVDNLRNLYPQIQVLKIPLTGDWRILGNGIGIRKGNDELRKAINEVVRGMKRDGFIRTL